MKTYPENCISCGLYKNCSSWNIRGRGHTPADILVVGQGPGRQEDFQGEIFVGPSGQFLQDFLDRLDVTWRLANATNCYPGKNLDGQGDNKPTKEQVQACSVFLKEEIEKTNPKVIICLGDTAMRAVLGDKAPRTLTEGKRKTYSINGIKVLINYHPVNHVTGRQNLLDSYIHMFQYAEKIVSGEVSEEHFKWGMPLTELQALQLIPSIGMRIYLDVETAVHKDNPNKRTLFHKDAKLLSLSVTWWDGDDTTGQYRNVVFAKQSLTKKVIMELLTNRVVYGHNVKYDLVAIWALTGVNPYNYINALPHDTFLAFYQQDQSKLGNGLKPLASRFFFAPDWESEVWAQVDRKNEELKALNRAIVKENLKRKKAGEELLPKHELWADFEDVELTSLCEYNARDTFYTARLHREALKEKMPDTACYKLAQRMTKALSFLEMNGLPVDLDRLRVVQQAVRNKHDRIMKTLLDTPEVKAVTETGHTDVENGVEYSPRPFNDKSYLFLESLAARVGYHTGERTPSGRLAFGKLTLQALGLVREPEKQKTRAQWIWYYLYQIRQLRHMSEVFLGKMFIPYVVGGRLRTTYKLGKAELGLRTSGADVSGGAETGRLSSANPNLQNLKKDKILRGCFRAPDGWMLAEFDYDRIEVVILAALSGDENLKATVQLQDFHTETAKKIFKLKPGIEPTKEQRNWAKTMVFAIIYGQLPSTYAQKNGCSVEEAETMYNDFFKAYPKVRPYFQDIEERVRRGEVLTSIWGRARSFQLFGDNRDWSVYNEAKNTGIQSTATDITSWMLCELMDELERNDIENFRDKGRRLTLEDMFPINVVHDSIWIQCREDRLQEVIQFMTELMEDMSRLPINLGLPIRVSHTFGKDLAQTL